MYLWACPHCEFTVWTPSNEVVYGEIKSHCIHHFRDAFSRTFFKTSWTCTKCGAGDTRVEENDAVASFQDHMLNHLSDRIGTSTNMQADIGGSADVLFLTPEDRRGIHLIRKAFVCQGDVVVTVTRDVKNWLKLLSQRTEERPKQVILISPSMDLPEQIASTRITPIPLEENCSIGAIGKTLTKSLTNLAGDDQQITVEFDMLSRVIDACDTNDAFRFLHLVDGLTSKVGANAIFPFDPAWVPHPTLNVFANLFDIVLLGERDRLRRYVLRKYEFRDEEAPDRTSARITVPVQRMVQTGADRNSNR